jgi:hypothetical protein
MGGVIAPVRVSEESLGAVANPFYRPADALRCPQRHDFLGIDENLRAKTTADVGGDHAQLVLRRHADKGGDDQPCDMRVLGGVPQREGAGAGIVIADRRARLDRIRHQPIVDDVELADVLGRLERRVDRFGVAEMPLIDRVVRRDVVDQRRSGFLRRRRIGDGRKDRVIDFDFLRGIARLRQRFRDHHRDRIADMASFADGERRMRRHFHWRAVLGMNHPAADKIADLVIGKLGAGEDGEHARHAGRGLGVNRFDRGMRVGRTQEIGKNLARAGDVVGVVTHAGDEAAIFLAAHCGADTGSAHVIALRQSLPGLVYSAALLAEPPPRMARPPAAIALTILW